eukprot:gnl/MRDRNA2_/MRDRNA2_88027_c0_seq1.p1 gnl/MRDRNA2_/MRDRNA2_88027_c0~~gnl/MRDRNA2_/MRDRNA2_88027_c0_seq1.p1  ORF type:complete len:113 (+),score=20.20 gnl/MRDRNA2_/MRDRNA2_88027_c0_seq1:97-435(+)
MSLCRPVCLLLVLCAAVLADKSTSLMRGEGQAHPKAKTVKILGKVVDNHFCKVLCQRFAMKQLSASFGGADFGDHPTKCVKECDVHVPAVVSAQQHSAEPNSKPSKSIISAH